VTAIEVVFIAPPIDFHDWGRKMPEILEKYDNKKIILDEQGLPKYLVEPYPFSPEEKKVLENCGKLFTQMELESIRKQADIEIRRKVLHEYLRMKVPEGKNKELLIEAIINRVMGYGDLSDFISDPNLEEIMVNGVNLPVYVFHKRFGMCPTNVIFHDREELFKIINRLCWIHDKDVAPIVDLSAIDGSRVNITSDPLTLHGPSITVRKQKKHLMTITEMLENGSIDVDLAALLWLAVDGMRMCPANLVIAGMIGSGKTTLLNALAMLTPPDDRIITIEDTPEMQLSGKDNWVPLAAQKGYDMETLVKNTLRMRPNRIVVGEIRGAEAMALFNAMNVGHKGMGTLHASSSREVIFRLQSPPMNVPMQIIANLDIIVVMNIFNLGGRPIRRITEVAEVGGHEGETVLLGTIYQWDPKKDRAVEGSEVSPNTYLDKLADKIKVSKREILDELNKRKALLINLTNRRIFEYRELLTAVNAFYRGQMEFVPDVSKELAKPTGRSR